MNRLVLTLLLLLPNQVLAGEHDRIYQKYERQIKAMEILRGTKPWALQFFRVDEELFEGHVSRHNGKTDMTRQLVTVSFIFKSSLSDEEIMDILGRLRDRYNFENSGKLSVP